MIFLTIVNLSCYSQEIESNEELAKKLESISKYVKNEIGVSLGTLVSLLKYEEGSYYPVWYLEEQGDMERVKILKKNNIIDYEILETIGAPKEEGPFFRIFLTNYGHTIYQALLHD